MLTETQIAERRKGIGGSDAAIVLGLSKFAMARELYHEKRGERIREDDPGMIEVLEWGQFMEPYVTNKYARRTGFTVHKPEKTMWHPSYQFMCGHPDGIVQEERRGFEAKTVVPALIQEFGEPGSDHIPMDYLIQCQHYMILTGFEVWDLVPMVGRFDFRLYHIHADAELQEMIIEGERDFIRRVREGDPPEIDYQHRNAFEVIKKCHPGTNGLRIEASPICVTWRTAMKQAAKEEAEAKKSKEFFRAKILDECGDNSIIAFPDGKAYRRKLIEKAAYMVNETSYMDFREVNDK